MKILLFLGSIICFSFTGQSQDLQDQNLSGFDYEARKAMQVSNEELLKLLVDKDTILLDIRFEEEQKAWSMPCAVFMPLPEQSSRHIELDKSKTIVTACPHKDRAVMAMVYLKNKGYEVTYLQDGLLGLADYLRVDKARKFIKKLD